VSRLLQLRMERDCVARRLAKNLVTGPDEREADLQRYIEDIVCLSDYCGSSANKLRLRVRPFEHKSVDDVRLLCEAVASIAEIEGSAVPRQPWWHAERCKCMRQHAHKSTTIACIENAIERGTLGA